MIGVSAATALFSNALNKIELANDKNGEADYIRSPQDVLKGSDSFQSPDVLKLRKVRTDEFEEQKPLVPFEANSATLRRGGQTKQGIVLKKVLAPHFDRLSDEDGGEEGIHAGEEEKHNSITRNVQ